MRFAELDAVTVDGYGTLVRLSDPVPLFQAQLRGRGVDCGADAIRAGFAAEVAYYRPNALRGRDPDTLAALRLECTRIFLEGAGADLDAGVVRRRVHGLDRDGADRGRRRDRPLAARARARGRASSRTGTSA